MKFTYVLTGVLFYFVATSAYGQLLPPSEKSRPSFLCEYASTQIEKWICEDSALGNADLKMARAYSALNERAGSSRKLYLSQTKWLSERNRCKDPACVALAYEARNSFFTKELNVVKDLGAYSLASLPSGYINKINAINDTRGLQLVIPAAEKLQKLNVEFYPDPHDRRIEFDEGPFVEIECTPPGALEGYAPRFHFHKRNSGLAIAPIKRENQTGYLFMHMTLGKDLPLNENIYCRFGFSSWLLDKPSFLYIVPVTK